MIRKLIILAIVLVLAYIFYKKYMAQTMEPFLQEKTGNVDFMSLTTPTLDKAANATSSPQ